MTNNEKRLEKAAEHLCSGALKLIKAILLKHDAAIIEASQEAIEAAVAAEREKSIRLWMLLDDVDTADDIAKADDAIYRSLCRQAHAKRWNVLNGDEVDAANYVRERGNI